MLADVHGDIEAHVETAVAGAAGLSLLIWNRPVVAAGLIQAVPIALPQISDTLIKIGVWGLATIEAIREWMEARKTTNWRVSCAIHVIGQ